MSSAPRRKKRVRRSAGEAREAILDAAEKRLDAGGPAGLRLQEIAADVGISHPTILHHFGSREGLVDAVVQRALESVQRDAVAAFASETFDTPDAAALLARVASVLRDRGHARLIAWLALEGAPTEDPAKMLKSLADVMHARREAELGRTVPREDTLFLVVLASLTLLAEAVFGAGTWDSADLANDRGAPDRFQSWLVELLREHMHRAPAAPTPPQKPRKRS